MKVVTLRGELLVLWRDLNRNESVVVDKNGRRHPKRFGPHRLTAAMVEEELQKLPDSATLAEIQAVAGHVDEVDLHLRCDECGEEVTQLLHFGHQYLHTTSARHFKSFDLCAKCVHAAFALWETESR